MTHGSDRSDNKRKEKKKGRKEEKGERDEKERKKEKKVEYYEEIYWECCACKDDNWNFVENTLKCLYCERVKCDECRERKRYGKKVVGIPVPGAQLRFLCVRED